MSNRTRDQIAADAIIAEIKAKEDWTQGFLIVRRYVAAQDKAETAQLNLLVQANGTTERRITKRHREAMHGITITVRRNVDPKNVAAVDALSAFVEELADFFRVPRGRKKIAGTNVYVASVQAVPVNPDEFESSLNFVAGVALTLSELVDDVQT